MNENEKLEKTTPSAQSATSPYTGEAREKVIKRLEQFIADFKPFCGNKSDWQQVYDALALLKAQDQQWTPITFRPLTDEEKAEHSDWCYIIDSPTPDDGEEILVSDGRYVWADAWYNNGVECYLESDHELEGVAWMKMPTPWKREATPWQGH